MVSYKSCKARPPFSIGLSLQDIYNNFGINPTPPAETKVEEPKIEEEIKVEEPTVEEPKVEEPINTPEPQEEVKEEPVIENEPANEAPEGEESKQSTSLEELDLTPKYIKQLEASNITSIEELIATVGEEWNESNLSGLSRAAKQAVRKALLQWQNEQKTTTSTETN